MSNKKKEIDILHELIKMDGYFTEYFKADLDQMVRNITNDHPIELFTKFHSAVEAQKERGDALIKKHVDEKYILYRKMLCAASDTSNEDLYDSVVECIGLDSTIKLKHALKLELSDTEIGHLVSKIK